MMDVSVTAQSRYTLLDAAFFWQENQPMLTLQWAATLIFSSCCNSRFQNEPWVNPQDVSFHCVRVSLSVSLCVSLPLSVHTHTHSNTNFLSLFSLPVAVAFSCSGSLGGCFLYFLIDIFFSFHSPVSPHPLSKWLTFPCIFLCVSLSLSLCLLLVLLPNPFSLTSCSSSFLVQAFHQQPEFSLNLFPRVTGCTVQY